MFRAVFLAAVLLLAVAALVAGLTVPALRFTSFVWFDEDQSIVDTVRAFWQGQEFFLAVVIGFFSILFPLFKLSVLSWLYLRSVAHRSDRFAWLGVLGKWSMLDVFVVFTTLGCIQLGMLGQTELRPGIYWYAASVILSIIAASLLVGAASPPRRAAPALQWLASLMFAAGVALPLMRVEKWWFWEQQFSLLGALWAMVGQGRWLLPVLFGWLVLLGPALILLTESTGCLPRLRRDGHWRHWCMLDVFVIGMLLVWFKVREQATVELLPGFWLLLAAVLLSWLAYLLGLVSSRGETTGAGPSSDSPSA